MKITLAQAVSLRNILARRIQELLSERSQVAIVTVPIGEKYELPMRTIEKVTEELNEVRAHYRKLDVAMAAANISHTISWDGQEITIMEAIELAKQLRGELNVLKQFASRNKQEYRTQYGEVVMVEHAMYEPDEYKEKAKKLEKKVNRLSYLIEAENHKVTFPLRSTWRNEALRSRQEMSDPRLFCRDRKVPLAVPENRDNACISFRYS